MDANGCPVDYDELVTNYFAMARSIVSRAPGVRPQDVDELTQDILVKFIAKDFLSQYDPNKTFSTPSGPRTARFPTFFRSFVRKFLRTPIETLAARRAREPVRIEQPMASGDLWIEVHAPEAATADAFEYVEIETELNRAYKHLGTIRVSEDRSTTLADVMRAMVRQTVEDGRVTRSRLAPLFGVQDTTISEWSGRVLSELREIGFLAGEYRGEYVLV